MGRTAVLLRRGPAGARPLPAQRSPGAALPPGSPPGRIPSPAGRSAPFPVSGQPAAAADTPPGSVPAGVPCPPPAAPPAAGPAGPCTPSARWRRTDGCSQCWGNSLPPAKMPARQPASHGRSVCPGAGSHRAPAAWRCTSAPCPRCAPGRTGPPDRPGWSPG